MAHERMWCAFPLLPSSDPDAIELTAQHADRLVGMVGKKLRRGQAPFLKPFERSVIDVCGPSH